MNILSSTRKVLFCLCVSALGACSENGGVVAMNPPPAAPAMGGNAAPKAGAAAPSGMAGTGMTTSPTTMTGGAGTTTTTPPAGMAGMTASAAGMAAPAAGSGATAGSTAAVGGSSAAGGAGGMAASMSPTLTRIFEEVIVPGSCNSAGACHRGPGGGKLDLTDKDTAYKSMVGVMAMGMSSPTPPTPNCSESGLMRVKAGDPANSLLMNKIESTMPKCGMPMPPGGPLDAGQIKLVKDWIMAGAKND